MHTYAHVRTRTHTRIYPNDECHLLLVPIVVVKYNFTMLYNVMIIIFHYEIDF